MHCYVIEVKRGPERGFYGLGKDREGTYFPATSLEAIAQFSTQEEAQKALDEVVAGAQTFLLPPSGALVGYFTFRITSVVGQCFGDLYAQPVSFSDVAAVRQYAGGPVTIKVRDGSGMR